MQGPPLQAPPADIGAQAMQSTAALGGTATLAASQLLNGLSGMLVSAGLTRLIHDLLGQTQGQTESKTADAETKEAAGEASKPAAAEDLAGMGANMLREMVVQGMVGRIVALNTANTYLSLATAEQLRRWGSGLEAGERPAPPQQPVVCNAPVPWPGAYPMPQQMPYMCGPFRR